MSGRLDVTLPLFCVTFRPFLFIVVTSRRAGWPAPAGLPGSGEQPAALGHDGRMDIPPRLAPLLEQYDWGCLRLINRMTGPEVDSGNGAPVPVPPLTTAEYRWEPVPGAWSVRRRAEGPGPRATWLVGAGDWGRDGYRDAEPYPPPFTTIAWRLSHLSEMLALRADYTSGGRSLTKDAYVTSGDADGAVAAFAEAVEAWRNTLLS